MAAPPRVPFARDRSAAMQQELIFINSTGDTFTPTHSGAIATWIWEMCRAAQGLSLEPWVITRDSTADAYPWVRTVEMSYPHPPGIRGAGRLCRWISVKGGWGHVRQEAWSERILHAVKTNRWESATLVFHNDPELVGSLRRKLPGARFIHLFHNCNPCLAPWRRKFSESVDVAIAVSGYCARWNESHFSCPVHILRNGVDIRRFSPKHKPPGKRPVIGFVGRTDRQKAPDLLLRAALKIAPHFNGFDVQLLGARYYGSHEDDPYQKQLERMSAELIQKGVNVRRPGFISRLAVPRWIAESDIHVVPSRWEDPCPLTVLEGMATGQATVAASCGGVPEIVGPAGFLFERDDAPGLEARLRTLLQNDELRRSYGRRARERAEQRPWSCVFGEFLEIVSL